MIRYDRLWDTMAARGMTQYRLIKQHNFSAGQIGRLKKNMHVSTHTLDTLCTLLDCGINDIVEYVPDSGLPSEKAAEKAPEETTAVLSARPKKTEASKNEAKSEKAKKAGKAKKGEKKKEKGKKK